MGSFSTTPVSIMYDIPLSGEMLKIATPIYISIGLVGCVTTYDPLSSSGLIHSELVFTLEFGKRGGESYSRILRTFYASGSIYYLASLNYSILSGTGS